MTAGERSSLTARRDEARAGVRSSLVRSGLASFAVCGVLAVLTLLASDASAVIVVGFWTVFALLFTVWTGLPMRRHWHGQVQALEAALGVGRARVTRVTTRRVVQFEEVEDEGAVWAFDAGEGRTFFVTGQEYYASEGFPSSDFSIVEVLAPNGLVVDEIVSVTGERIEPERVVAAARKQAMDVPEHLTVAPIPIDRVGR